MVTYIIHEVWSNLCIQFSSVKKGHSLSSYRIPCAVPHLKPSSYQLKCFVMCTFAPTRTPHIPSQIHCNSVFQFCDCHVGRPHAAEEQTRWKLFANMWPLSGLDFTWTSAFHQGRHAPTRDQNPTLSARLGLILCLPISLLD